MMQKIKTLLIAASLVLSFNAFASDLAKEKRWADQVVDAILDGLARQMYSPVRWVDSVQQMVADGATQLVECGPGKVLTGLARRIDRSLPAVCIESPESITKAMS